jgi:hypothetical protein
VSGGERTAGYCVGCGDYVLGRFVRVIGAYADAVDGHRGCPERPAAPGRAKAPPAREGRVGGASVGAPGRRWAGPGGPEGGPGQEV